MTNNHDKTAIAQQMEKLWEPLSDAERAAFVEHLQLMECKANQKLFAKGDTPTLLYYLVKGRVTVYCGEKEDCEMIIRMVEPGCIFGMQAAFAGTSYVSTAIAEADSVVAYVPLQLIFRFVSDNPKVALVFLRDISKLLGYSVNYTVHLTQKKIRGRLAETILRMKEKYGVEADGKTLPVYLSRNDMAMMSNMSLSNAIRTLSAFVSEGIIRFNARKISILNEHALQQNSLFC